MTVKTNRLPTTASGASFVTGVVIGVEGVQARVRILGNKVIRVRTDLLRGKSAVPKAGETWILDQPYGTGWMFAVPIGYQGIDKQPQWTAASLLGAWTNFSTPGVWTPGSGLAAPAAYCLDQFGWLTLQGAVKGGTITASNAAGPISADVLQLPAGCRPGNKGQLTFAVVSAASTGQVLVMPDGYVRVLAGANSYVSLNGVRFMAEQ